MPRRIVSKDTGLGFAICIMLIVHIFSHQIGQSNSELFLPLVNQMSPFLLITLIPLMIVAVWGSCFTMLSCMALTIKIKEMDPKDNKLFGKFILGRVIAGGLMVFLWRLFHWLMKTKDGDSIFKEVHGIIFNFAGGALDSIAIVGVLVPTLVFFIRKIEKLRDVRYFTAIFVGLTLLCLSLSYFIIPWGRNICTHLDEQNLFFFEYWLSKLVYGRFKVAYTFSFGCMGAFIGYLIASDVKVKTFSKIIHFFTLTCFSILGVVAIFNFPYFAEEMLKYADLDSPLIVQYFNLGAQALVFSWFIKSLDLGSAERNAKAGKRTTWLRRFGVVSLTIFTMGRVVADGVFWILELIMGPALDLSGTPRLAWNTLQIYFFIFLVFVCWQGILFLWEKMNYVLSMEWIISAFAVLLRLKKSPNLHVKERLYNPGSLEYYLELEKEKSLVLVTTPST